MRFYVDRDEGHEVVGWLAPDNPNETPVLRVVVPNRGEEYLVEASFIRSDIKDLGLHNTGLVGFLVDESVVPNLEEVDGLELLDNTSGMLIYKRFKITRHQKKRLIFYVGSAFPQRKLVTRLQSSFATSYERVERMSFDTLSNILASPYLVSNLCIGQPMYLRYAHSLRETNYIIAALLRDPYQELAERILFLNLLSRKETPQGLSHYVEGYESLMPLVADLPGKDERSLRLAIRSLSAEQRRVLANPYTRAFGCNIGEEPDFRTVSTALESLASFDVVGIRDRFDDFTRLFNATLDTNALTVEDGPERYNAVEELASRLSRITSVTQLLEHDLALYSYVEEAVLNGLGSV